MRLANQAQDGIATSADAQLTSHIRSGLAPDFESELTEGLLEPFGALSVRATKLWKSFHEDLLRTGTLFAKETTHMHNETDWMQSAREDHVAPVSIDFGCAKRRSHMRGKELLGMSYGGLG